MPGHYGKMKKPMKGKKVVGKRKKLDIDKDGKLTKKDFAMLRMKKKKMMGNRKKLAANKDGNLTKQDFAMLRKKKKK